MTAICGMIGAWASAPDAEAHLDAMLDALARDPEHVASWVDRAARCRLGIASRYGAGEQPHAIVHGDLVAVCDGRLFDGGDARDADRRLVQLWAGDGPHGFGDADAHFALASWDRTTERLTLARDALGVRSLYYHEGDGGVVFASTIEALLRHPAVPRDLDVRALSHFLTFLDVPTPGTLFAGIAKLPPGALATCTARGVERVERFWDLYDDPWPEEHDLAYHVERVRQLHRRALEARLDTGPMAALLSGGNDSSANVALMAKAGVPELHTFTVGLAELEGKDGFSDLVHARRVADLVGTIHHERLITTDDFIASMARVIDVQCDLVSEPSSVFLHHALEMVRDQGLPVVITGEANDEISCGHGGMIRFRDGYYRRWRPLMRLPRGVRRWLARAVPLVSPRHADVLARAAADGEYFWSYELGWSDHDKAEILSAAFDPTRDAPAAAIVAERAGAVRRGAQRDYLAQVIGMMMQDHYLGNLMLGKLEQLSSRLGIEARCPYAAAPYVRFVYNIPAQLKTRDGEVKTFFKAAIRDLLPDDVVYRPKQGFRTPTPELFRGRFGEWAEPRLLETGLTRAGVLRRDTLAGLLAEHRSGARDRSTKLWAALVLNLWHERWLERGATRAPASRARRHAA